MMGETIGWCACSDTSYEDARNSRRRDDEGRACCRSCSRMRVISAASSGGRKLRCEARGAEGGAEGTSWGVACGGAVGGVAAAALVGGAVARAGDRPAHADVPRVDGHAVGGLLRLHEKPAGQRGVARPRERPRLLVRGRAGAQGGIRGGRGTGGARGGRDIRGRAIRGGVAAQLVRVLVEKSGEGGADLAVGAAPPDPAGLKQPEDLRQRQSRLGFPRHAEQPGDGGDARGVVHAGDRTGASRGGRGRGPTPRAGGPGVPGEAGACCGAAGCGGGGPGGRRDGRGRGVREPPDDRRGLTQKRHSGGGSVQDTGGDRRFLES